VSLPDDPALTHEGWAVGTPSYISPEVLQGQTADVSSDLYALGAILYYLLSGAPPFVSDDMHKVLHAHLHEEVVPLATRVDQEIPYGLERVVMRCLDKDPRRRYSSAIELSGALQPFC
jgi:serine/threonine-protein kinase